MKKLFLIFIFSLLLSACGNKAVIMDVPAEDGNYHFSYKDLGFSLILPKEFKYYQVQQKNDKNKEYSDVEFFVPTSDKSYAKEVPDYAKPFVVRVFNKDSWDKNSQAGDPSYFQKVKEKGDKVYTMQFWTQPPKDWNNKWNPDMKDQIIKSFTLN